MPLDDDGFPRTPAGGINQIAWLESRVTANESRLQRVELRLAEHVGVCGDGGHFQTMGAEMKELREEVEVQKRFRIKALTYASIGIPVAAFLAALLSHWIQTHL